MSLSDKFISLSLLLCQHKR